MPRAPSMTLLMSNATYMTATSVDVVAQQPFQRALQSDNLILLRM